MYKYIIRLFAFSSLFLLSNLTIAKTVQEEITEIKAMIESEIKRNEELKNLLAVNEKEIDGLKQNLKDIELKISSLKQEHNIQ